MGYLNSSLGNLEKWNLEFGIWRIFLSKAACFVRNFITLSLSVILSWYLSLNLSLSELARAESKVVFKFWTCQKESSFVVLHQESSVLKYLLSCFCFWSQKRASGKSWKLNELRRESWLILANNLWSCTWHVALVFLKLSWN